MSSTIFSCGNNLRNELTLRRPLAEGPCAGHAGTGQIANLSGIDIFGENAVQHFRSGGIELLPSAPPQERVSRHDVARHHDGIGGSRPFCGIKSERKFLQPLAMPSDTCVAPSVIAPPAALYAGMRTATPRRKRF
jgi:hypothetical protein